jgi:hypothetical protein
MMKHSPPTGLLRSLPVAVALVLTSACGGWSFAPGSSPAPSEDIVPATTAPPEPAPAPPPVIAAPVAPTPAVVRDPALERQIANLELRLLEKEAQAEDLQVRLDDARREVVRALGGQRSRTTQAEAASAIEAAQTTLESLPADAAAHAINESTRLIELARAELENRNYAGSAYLANEAQSAAAAVRGQFANAGQEPPRPGELAFTLPLHLETSSRANVREGPGTSFGVLFTLPTDAPLVAYSSDAQWLRVADDSGQRGWIHESLIRPRR